MKLLFKLFCLTLPLILLSACGEDTSVEKNNNAVVAEEPVLLMFYTDG